MKKSYFHGIITVITLAVFFGVVSVTHANVDNAVPLDQNMNVNLEAVPVKKIDLQFVQKTITSDSALFSINLKALANTSSVMVISIKDPSNKEIAHDVIFSKNIFSAGQSVPLPPKTFSGLKPATTYTMQISDTSQGLSDVVFYQKLSFETLPPPPPETTETKDVQKASFSIIPNDPVIDRMPAPVPPTATTTESYSATFSGKFTSTLNMRTNLQLWFGPTEKSLAIRGTLFANAVIPKDVEQSYTLTIPDLRPNTTYWYKIYESTKNFDAQGLKSFTTPLDGTALESTAPVADQKAAISVNMDPSPVFKENKKADGSIGSVDVTISGKVITTLNTKVGLSILMGEDSTSLFKTANMLLPEKLIFKGVEKKFSQTLIRLKPGTKYYYKVQETSKDFFVTPQVLSFTTPGTSLATFDPDAAGALIDYDFNTNIGEPTGDGSAEITAPSVLVPCGKRADDLDNDPKTVDPDQNCKFEHLMILFGRIIDYLLVLLAPLTVLVAIYTGVQMILHRGMPAELTKYKDNLIRIGWGVAVMLLAWTIIATLLKSFVDPGSMRFILLDLLG